MAAQTPNANTQNSSAQNPTLQAPRRTQAPRVNLETVRDFSNVCRLCATTTEFVIPIFNGEGIHKNLSEKIHKHLPIRVSQNDRLPQVVCYQCASTLLAWHELVECCVQAEKAMQTTLRTRWLVEEVSRPIGPPPRIARGLESSRMNDQLKDSNNFTQTLKTILMNYCEAINLDIKEDSIVYVCHKCKDTSQNLDMLTSHLLSQHMEELTTTASVKEFVDNNVTFEEVLINSDNESIEEARNSEDESYMFQCGLCNICFTSSTRLLCHMNKHANNVSNNQYVCEICQHTDENKIKFINHLRSHAIIIKDDSKICKSCGFLAEDMDKLRNHILESHAVKKTQRKTVKITNQKYIPTSCPECKKMFSNKYNLNVHMKQHTGITKRFACDGCNKTFSNESNLKKHKRIQHEGIVEFTCSHCGEGFPTKVSRDTHYKSHTGDHPHTCYICSKSFKVKDTLKKHIDSHLDIRKYRCDVCEKKFRKKSHLDYHIRTHRT